MNNNYSNEKFQQNISQQNSVETGNFQQNLVNVEQSIKNVSDDYNAQKNINNKKNIFIILIAVLVVIIAIVVIKSLFSGGNDNSSVRVDKNQKLVECEMEVTIENEKTKKLITSYVIEDAKIVKYIKTGIHYLDVSSNELTEDDAKKFEKDGLEECNTYPNEECEFVVDYQEGKIFKYDMILSGSLLDSLNSGIEGLSDEEIIEKIKEKENYVSCEVK